MSADPPVLKQPRHVLQGHTDDVSALAWSPAGDRLVSASFDKTVAIWDMETGARLRTLRGHEAWVNAVAVSPDGARIISASSDGTIRVWDATSGKQVERLAGHALDVWAMDIAPDGRTLVSGSHDRTVRVWDLESGREIARLTGHDDTVLAVRITKDGQIVTASDDRTIRLWSLTDGRPAGILTGHGAPVRALALIDSGSTIVSASMDRTMKVWDRRTHHLVATLEGHSAAIGALSVSFDAQLFASAAFDYTVRLWRSDSFAPAAVVHSAASKFPVGLAFHPSARTIATTDRATRILIWDYDEELSHHHPAVVTSYVNAKVALVGQAGSGKTCLARALVNHAFEPQESTHGMKVWNLSSETVPRADGHLTRETFLWDFAGQRDYQIVHQLFLEQTALGVVVFDPADSDDPFPGVERWRHALSRVAGHDCPRLLVAGRVDRGHPAARQSQIEDYCRAHDFAEYVATSAKTGEGVEELRRAIVSRIDWDALPFTSSPALWNAIREFLLYRRDDPDVLVPAAVVHEAFRRTHPRARHTDEEFATVLGHAQAQGLIWTLSFGGLVLLKPELLNNYAAEVAHAAQQDPAGIGSVRERDVLDARIPFFGRDRVADSGTERLLLHAVVELMLDRELAFREGELLVFPSKHSRADGGPGEAMDRDVVYRFAGAVETIHATLIVRLTYSGAFVLAGTRRGGATFHDSVGNRCSVAVESTGDGAGRLELAFERGASLETRVLFQRFIHEHLSRRVTAGSLRRDRVYRCPTCSEEVQDARAVSVRLARGLTSIRCQFCEAWIALVDGVEERFGQPELVVTLRLLETTINENRSSAVNRSTLLGKTEVEAFDVFLAYHSRDGEQVAAIGEALRRRGVNPWFDRWNLPPGRRFAEEIERVLPGTSSVAVFVGAGGTGPWESFEIYAALQLFVTSRRPVIPVLLPTAETEPTLPLFLQQFGWVRFNGADDRDALDRLQWGITGSRPGELAQTGLVARAFSSHESPKPQK